MKELKIDTTNLTPADANALIICDCGAIIAFNALDVRMINQMIAKCDVCKTEILIIDGGPGIHGEA